MGVPPLIIKGAGMAHLSRFLGKTDEEPTEKIPTPSFYWSQMVNKWSTSVFDLNLHQKCWEKLLI